MFTGLQGFTLSWKRDAVQPSPFIEDEGDNEKLTVAVLTTGHQEQWITHIQRSVNDYKKKMGLN